MPVRAEDSAVRASASSASTDMPVRAWQRVDVNHIGLAVLGQTALESSRPGRQSLPPPSRSRPTSYGTAPARARCATTAATTISPSCDSDTIRSTPSNPPPAVSLSPDSAASARSAALCPVTTSSPASTSPNRRSTCSRAARRRIASASLPSGGRRVSRGLPRGE